MGEGGRALWGHSGLHRMTALTEPACPAEASGMSLQRSRRVSGGHGNANTPQTMGITWPLSPATLSCQAPIRVTPHKLQSPSHWPLSLFFEAHV